MTVDARWRVWCTDAHVVALTVADLEAAVTLLVRQLSQVDAVASRFRDDSELRRLHAGRRQISPLLARLLATALQAAEETDGLVDPTLGAPLHRAGYDRTFDELPADGPAAVTLPPEQSWREVQLDGTALTLPPGVELDLGATAKAWLVDDVADVLSRRGVTALINIGGDIALAGDPPPDGWPVAVGDPGDPVQVVRLRSALATSSTHRRRWRRGGVELHHLLDPRTGRPAQAHWRTVSVTAESCVAANTASTAAVVLGPEAARWLVARGRPARLVPQTGPVVTVGGWPTGASRESS